MGSEELKNTETYGFILLLPHFRVKCKISVLHVIDSLWWVVTLCDPLNPEQQPVKMKESPTVP